MMPPAVNVLALSIDHDRLTPVVAGSTGDVWPPRAAAMGQAVSRSGEALERAVTLAPPLHLSA